jgi:hypothetical protein
VPTRLSRAIRLAPTGTRTARSAIAWACSTGVLGWVDVVVVDADRRDALAVDRRVVLRAVVAGGLRAVVVAAGLRAVVVAAGLRAVVVAAGLRAVVVAVDLRAVVVAVDLRAVVVAVGLRAAVVSLDLRVAVVPVDLRAAVVPLDLRVVLRFSAAGVRSPGLLVVAMVQSLQCQGY